MIGCSGTIVLATLTEETKEAEQPIQAEHCLRTTSEAKKTEESQAAEKPEVSQAPHVSAPLVVLVRGRQPNLLFSKQRCNPDRSDSGSLLLHPVAHFGSCNSCLRRTIRPHYSITIRRDRQVRP
jgi:hypothetical protein